MGFFSKVGEYLFGTSIPDATEASAFFAVYFFDRESALQNKPGWFQVGGWFDRMFEKLTSGLSWINDLIAGTWNKAGIQAANDEFKTVKDTLDNTHYNATGVTTQIPQSIQQAAVDEMESVLERSYGAGARYSTPNFADIGQNAHNLSEPLVEEAVFRAMLAKNNLGKMENVNYAALKAQYESDPNLKPLFTFAENMAAVSADKLQSSLQNKDATLLELTAAEQQSLNRDYEAAQNATAAFGETFTTLQKHILAARDNAGLKALGLSDESIVRIAFKTIEAEQAGVTGDSKTHLTSDELVKLAANSVDFAKSLEGKDDLKARIRERLSNPTDIDISDAAKFVVTFEGNGLKAEDLVVR